MLSEDELASLKKLCHLQCTEEEEKEFLTSLSSVLKYIDQIQEVDTKHISPCNNPCFEIQASFPHPLRIDEEGELLSRDLFLTNAPDHVGGMIRVPAILGEP